MKNKISLFFLFGLFITLFSCKKEDPVADCDIQPSFNLPGKPGTRWIYQWYKVDSNNNETLFSAVDTITLIGDSIINGKLFQHFDAGFQFLLPDGDIFRRDSNGYIIDQTGSVKWNYLGDTTYSHYVSEVYYTFKSRMHSDQIPLSVLGETKNSLQKNFIVCTTNGTDLSPCAGNEVINRTNYVSGIGEVEHETQLFSQIENCEKYRRRLIEFYIPE